MTLVINIYDKGIYHKPLAVSHGNFRFNINDLQDVFKRQKKDLKFDTGASVLSAGLLTFLDPSSPLDICPLVCTISK